jgi:hypothetical protein
MYQLKKIVQKEESGKIYIYLLFKHRFVQGLSITNVQNLSMHED